MMNKVSQIDLKRKMHEVYVQDSNQIEEYSQELMLLSHTFSLYIDSLYTCKPCEQAYDMAAKVSKFVQE